MELERYLNLRKLKLEKEQRIEQVKQSKLLNKADKKALESKKISMEFKDIKERAAKNANSPQPKDKCGYQHQSRKFRNQKAVDRLKRF